MTAEDDFFDWLKREGVTDGSGLFDNWPTQDGWEYALKVAEANKAKAEAEVEALKRKGDKQALHQAAADTNPIRVEYVISEDGARRLVDAMNHWQDHECEWAIHVMEYVLGAIVSAVIPALEYRNRDGI